MSVADIASRLEVETEEYREVLIATRLPDLVINRVERQMSHLREWQGAFELLE